MARILLLASVEWVPELRTMAHFCGALAVPGYTSLLTSSLIYSYENRKINKENKLRGIEETQEEQDVHYKMNSKLKNNLLKASMAVGSIGYIAFCGMWENFQFSQTNILQLPQYIADISGPLIGMETIGTIDVRPLYDKIDKFKDRILKNSIKLKKVYMKKSLNLKTMRKIKNKKK